jgi:hypothetical protein
MSRVSSIKKSAGRSVPGQRAPLSWMVRLPCRCTIPGAGPAPGTAGSSASADTTALARMPRGMTLSTGAPANWAALTFQATTPLGSNARTEPSSPREMEMPSNSNTHAAAGASGGDEAGLEPR